LAPTNQQISHIRVAFEFDGSLKGKERSAYPLPALREALLNAVVNGDYAESIRSSDQGVLHMPEPHKSLNVFFFVSFVPLWLLSPRPNSRSKRSSAGSNI
jgi:hypothetical protein